MPSKSKLIAEEVGALLSSILMETAVVVSEPDYQMDRVPDRKIFVWCSERESEISNRVLQAVTYSISVALIDKISTTLEELVDESIEAMETIGNRMIARQFEIVDGMTSHICDVVNYEHAPLYDRELLETRRIFGGGIILRILVAEPILRE